MKYVVSFLGVIVALGFALAAGIMNWKYGSSLGRSPEDQYLFAGVSAGVDAMKMLAPFFFWWSIKNRRWIPATLSGFAVVGFVAYSITGIMGFADLNRAMTTGNLSQKSTDAGDIKADLARKEGQLKALGTFEPPAVIGGKLETLQQDARWTRSKECTEATAAASRQFCGDYRALEAEKAKGLEAAKLETEITVLRRDLKPLAGVAQVDRGDPRAGIVSRLTGWELLKVQTWLSMLFVVIVEFMSTFGIFISLNHGELGQAVKQLREKQPAEQSAEPGPTAAAPQVPAVVRQQAEPIAIPTRSGRAQRKDVPMIETGRAPGDVAKFAVACLKPAKGGSVAVSDLYPRYGKWCEVEGMRAVSATDFERLFVSLCDLSGFARQIENGEAYCLNLQLAA